MHFRTGERDIDPISCLSYSHRVIHEKRNLGKEMELLLFLFVLGTFLVMITSPNETVLRRILFPECQGQNRGCNSSTCVCSKQVCLSIGPSVCQQA